MYFIPPFLIFLSIFFGILGRQHHNHEFIGLSHMFLLTAFAAGAVLFMAIGAASV